MCYGNGTVKTENRRETPSHPRPSDRWASHTGWSIEVQLAPPGTKGFSPVRIRWVVERTNAWHGRSRRNSKDYERKTESSAAMIQLSAIHLMLRRLAPEDPPVTFHYRRHLHHKNGIPAAA